MYICYRTRLNSFNGGLIMDLGLSGLNAVVTGASKGLGFAAALELLKEGANVLVNSRTQSNLEKARENFETEKINPRQVSVLAGDVTDQAFCVGLAEQAIKAFRGIDILITNSGGPPAGAFEQLNSCDWESAIDLSFNSHLHMIKSCLPYLKQSAAASVLAITSFTVKYPVDNLILSNSIRAATAALIKSLSLELGPVGIRFNSILPGWTLTGRVERLLRVRAEANQTSVEEEENRIIAAIPLRRMGQPQEFAKVAAFLVSPAASYINGVLLTVDGGITRGLF
jgi:3-oxoacyl-[acyl-carrier protein] reductase